jgi:pimeloyl-ACP methyl ester carboxylesterase
MNMQQPWVLEAGDGPGLVCLHSNASTSGQWKPLAQRLSWRHRVLAPDLYGAGRSPEWRWQRHLTLADEAELIEPVLARAGTPLALVGHSYGGAVALVAALRQPRRVGALVLYEPSLFAWVDADTPRPNDADGIRAAVEDAARLLGAGHRDAAAERFIDYWMEPGSWQRMPERRRAAIAATIPNVRRWGRALFAEPTPLAALRSLDVPVLLMIGDRTTASARAVTTRLLGALPQRELHEFEDVGHMGPVTHPDRVNAVIEQFLARTFPGRAPTQQDHAAALAA